ncbi:MAG: hypothetical protein R2748_29955 [Bryobacterales bacterium]
MGYVAHVVRNDQRSKTLNVRHTESAMTWLLGDKREKRLTAFQSCLRFNSFSANQEQQLVVRDGRVSQLA